MRESDSWYSRWYEGCLLNTLILQMNFPPVWWLASIDQPHIQRLVRRIDWWGWDIFFHTHSLDPKTEYIVDRASKYILKITTSPAVSFEWELNYYRALREAIWDMIPKTLFFSGKTAEIDEDYPGENHRIWALMRYVWRDALLGDLFDREYISSLKLYKTGRSSLQMTREIYSGCCEGFSTGQIRPWERLEWSWMYRIIISDSCNHEQDGSSTI